MTNYNQRYAFVTSTPLEPMRGWGTAVAVTGLLRALDRRGKKIGLVTPPRQPLPPLWSRWWFNSHLRRSLATLDADSVIGIDGDGYRFARAQRKQRFVAYLHGVKADELRFAHGSARKALARESRWERTAAAAADLVITPSEYARQAAIESYGLTPGRVQVVSNGIDLDEWPVQPLPDTDALLVLCVANLIRRKDIDTLLRAWAQLCPGRARLQIVGSGPEESRLRDLARSPQIPNGSVEFTGALPQDRVRQALAGCHVFCLPSRQEAFGLAFLEAMACGRPVIGARAAAVPEVVGDAGILVPESDPAALADALKALIDSSELRREWAQRGRSRAERFSWDTSASRFGELLAELP